MCFPKKKPPPSQNFICFLGNAGKAPEELELLLEVEQQEEGKPHWKQQVYLAHDPVPSLLQPHCPAMNDLGAPLTLGHHLPSHGQLFKT